MVLAESVSVGYERYYMTINNNYW